ncbi:SCO family protein [Acidovorax radicis]|jgi:protein SCO1/2|uniref:SCO family protein n=1 Tax=Acidovorax radicis TaxID=758826 RepID=UPI001CFB3EB6|nr:SCO family protein [Acidovorax radicis]UCV00104.1 SCO family protein [Acidovorax radicis]
MLRTALLACLLALAGYASAAWLTHDFQIWTAEGARRLEVAQHPVPVPPVTVDGPGMAAQPLPALLAQGGGVTLVDFIYTRCQTVCLSLGSSFQQLQAALLADRAAGAHAGVRLLSISFDDAHDTPAVLQAYARTLQADPLVWNWVRVPDVAQQQALLQRLGVVVVPDGRGDYEHNAAFLVLDAQGRLVRVFDLAEQQLALDFARHLAQGGRL